MTWTVTIEESEGMPEQTISYNTVNSTVRQKAIPPRLHVRAIIDIDNEQSEIKDLIASLQKHVKEPT